LAISAAFPKFCLGDEVQAEPEELVRFAGNTLEALRSMATSLSTNGDNYYSSGDYAGACAIWCKSFAGFKNLKALGALIEN
jgi:hypothetical protein